MSSGVRVRVSSSRFSGSLKQSTQVDTKVGSDQFPVVELAVNAATMYEVEFFRENSFLASSWLFSQKLCGEENIPLTRVSLSLFSQKLCGEENIPLTRVSASVVAEARLGGGSTKT